MTGSRPRRRRPSELRARELRAHLLGDDPANYPETILSLTAEPICPECAAEKHQNCVGQALREETDELVPCYCPTCGAGDA